MIIASFILTPANTLRFCFSETNSDKTDKNVAKVCMDTEKNTKAIHYTYKAKKKKKLRGKWWSNITQPIHLWRNNLSEIFTQTKGFFVTHKKTWTHREKKIWFDKFIHLVINSDAEICLTLDIFFGFSMFVRSFVSKCMQFSPIFFSFTQSKFYIFHSICFAFSFVIW